MNNPLSPIRSNLVAFWAALLWIAPASQAQPVINSGPTDQYAAISSNATFSVTAQGTLPISYQWIFNSNGIIGATNAALTLTNVSIAHAGSYAVCVSNPDGSSTSTNATLYLLNLYAWGAGKTNTLSPSPPNNGQSIAPTNVAGFKAIAGGGYHSLALRANGRVLGWGNFLNGATNVPATLTNAATIAAGLNHSLAVRSNGAVLAWGDASYGQTTVPASATNVSAIAAGWYHSLALQSNGTVLAWGAGTSQSAVPYCGQCLVPTNLTGVTAVAAGGYHSLALQADGTVVAWGWNAAGQTNVPAGLSNVVAIAAGGSNSLALKNDGTLVTWGANSYGQTNVPDGLSNVVAIAAGAAHNMALKNDGTLVAWGLNGNGQTNVPAGLTNITAIAAGGYHSLALVNTGPVTFLNAVGNQTIYKGSTVTFSLAFLGTPPLNCQWLQNGTNITGGTNASLAIPHAQLTDAGHYQLVVSNSFGAVTSAVAVLTVNDIAPYFTAPPTNQWVLLNSNATLTASVGGIPPFAYQWQLNGTGISGATNATLMVTNAQPANEGNYSLIVSNAYGVTASSNAYLNVVDVPEALGPTNLIWQMNSTPPTWFVESTNTHDGFAAVAVGPLAYGKQAMLQTTVTGPGAVSFWWADSQLVKLTFSVDGAAKTSWSSYSIYWNNYTFYLSAGTHVLTWTALNSQFSYMGMAFLDQVSYVPGATAVSIATPPASQTNSAGSNVTFSVGTTGTPPMSYQWYFSGVGIAGMTNYSLVLTNIQAENIGAYSVVANNGCGVAVSPNALLSVLPAAPTITTHPVGGPVLLGGQAVFRGAAIGTSPMSYQWLFNNLPIANATNPELVISNVQHPDAGSYSLLASNTVGTAVSSNALLYAYAASELAAALDSAAITWNTMTNVPWFPQTNTTYDDVSAAQSGVITNSQQSTMQGVVTGPATVTYYWKVSCDSVNDKLAFGVNGTIQNSISGTVDWKPMTNYIGTGTQTLQWNLYPVYSGYAGGTGWVDQVQVVSGGTVAAIAVNPASYTTNAGNNVSFSVGAFGTPPLFYQWQFNGTNVDGATNATLALTRVQTNNAGTYAVTVSNDWGAATSSNATLVVNSSAPVITTQPARQAKTIHGSVTFSVTAKGSSPLNFQWQFNGTPIPDATGSSFSLAGLQPTNAGSYNVTITNDFGAVTSSVAILEVNPTVVLEYWCPLQSSNATPFGLSNVVAVAAGYLHTAALHQDGTVTAWGNNTYGQTNVPADLSNVTAVVAGYYHTAALKADGTVAVWGDNTYGQLLVPAGLSNVTAIAAAANDLLALKADGTVVAWGNNYNGQLNTPSGLSNVVAIAAGPGNGLAVKADGQVVQWGDGRLTAATGVSNVTAVAAGCYSGWMLQYDGTVNAWGWDESENFSGITTLAATGDNSGYDYDYVLLLKNDGTVVSRGENYSFTPLISVSPSNVVAISAGYMHAAVVVNDGTPQVAQPLLNRTVYSGSTVSFNSGMGGGAALNYQWLCNGTNLDGATNALLVLTNVPLSAAGNYTCMATNLYGAATNLNATLTVLRSTPWISCPGTFSSRGLTLQLDQLSGHGATIIMASTNLVNWVPILTNPPVTGTLQFLDPDMTNQPSRFYRAVEQ